jgi:hypothetical protein
MVARIEVCIPKLTPPGIATDEREMLHSLCCQADVFNKTKTLRHTKILDSTMVYHFSKCPTNEYSDKDMQIKKISDFSTHLFHFIFTTTQQASHKRQDVKDSL